MITVHETTLPGVLRIQKKMPAKDSRGIYGEIYQKREYFEKGIKIDFVEQDFSFSRKNVLRGLHGDTKTYKMVCCPYGAFFLAVVNYNQDSKDFGKSETFVVTAENSLQILIPPMHLNGHLVLSDEGAIFHYNQSEYYTGSENQWSVRWNDPRFNIPWPVENPVLSNRDGATGSAASRSGGPTG
ncbi:dTDP-4-dehydrorhamnose 3,5-epimerase family protein [bacterium]|nr:dTDP-4-dehydrorhamnose 3,5-epimerase family protein [bacterium]